MYKHHGSLLVALVVGLSFAFCVKSSDFVRLDAEDVPTPKVVFLGSVEGKSYFIDGWGMTFNWNWTEARDHCNASGLHLATITSAEQRSFLKDSYYDRNLPDGWYWTDGRESRDYSMFKWDSTGSQLPSIYQGEAPSYLEINYNACLYFLARLGNVSLVADECDQRVGVLCETR